MKIGKRKSNWFGLTSQKEERKPDAPLKTRCIHCSKQFKTGYGYHVACKACRTEEDYRRSFEWVLALAAAKA